MPLCQKVTDEMKVKRYSSSQECVRFYLIIFELKLHSSIYITMLIGDERFKQTCCPVARVKHVIFKLKFIWHTMLHKICSNMWDTNGGVLNLAVLTFL